MTIVAETPVVTEVASRINSDIEASLDRRAHSMTVTRTPEVVITRSMLDTQTSAFSH